MVCPYCQTNIKNSADVIICSSCKTPHHKECWEENKGCTVFGCDKNPNTGNKGIDIGDETIDSVKKIIEQGKKKQIPCPKCNALIPEGSLYCSYCGFAFKEENKTKAKEEFEKEFRKRYKEKTDFKKKHILITSVSITLIVILIFTSLFITIAKLNNYFNSDDYQVRNFLEEWRESWEKKDIAKYKSFLDKDYLYVDKDGKTYNLNERIKRINYTFENYKFIKIHISSIQIQPDTTSSNYKNVTFQQSYVSDAMEESGKKTLRLYKGNDKGDRWKIFREYFE